MIWRTMCDVSQGSQSFRLTLATFPGWLASACQRPGEGRVGSADVLGADRDRVAIRIALACGARRRKELPGGRRRFSGGEGEPVTPRTSRSPFKCTEISNSSAAARWNELVYFSSTSSKTILASKISFKTNFFGNLNICLGSQDHYTGERPLKCPESFATAWFSEAVRYPHSQP